MNKTNEKIDVSREYLMEVWDVLEDTVDCMVAVNGWSMKTMESILYWVSGYNSFDQADNWEQFFYDSTL